MFVRKKPNRSGIVSVQIIDKSQGRYRVLKTVGSSSDADEVELLVEKGKQMILRIHGQMAMDFVIGEDRHFIQTLDSHLHKVQLLGPDLVFGKLFREIGFHAIPDELFRHLVISRLVFPLSKLKTADYLLKFNGIAYEVTKIYRYLDKLRNDQYEEVQKISYRHTLEVLGEEPAVVFYDVTTLYFEAAEEDDLRVAGFSKDGKHQHPQVLLGLLVSYYGYPLAYQIFEGNKFEGHTMIPVIEAFKEKYDLGKLVVIADSGLLSKDNIAQLEAGGYEFILGARIKAGAKKIKEEILKLKLEDGKSAVLKQEDGKRLVISYSSKRARKDEYNRNRGIKKLEKNLNKGNLTKQHINNRGYNQFLSMTGEVKINIDYDKVDQASRWDGLKGYITNCSLSKEQVIEGYRQLWQIEKAFRISKTDLKIRPVYHRLKRRIESHICIAFCAYKVYKEFERQLKEKQTGLSPEKAIEILKTIYGLKMTLPQSKEPYTYLMAKEQEQIDLLKSFGI
ncbi:MAG: IS1634 family transposase [Bacteroidia bacterium]|nr:IS1634 family transposase [Bacteroidia bacterium]MCB9230763.1 IS1634 family transposase [Bacteroidia bacterium]MCB9230770.1 IS1634 family transposase [Bacteroidia bacterium]MCB9235896.1 IS1634 family transposase [Bacteroidia bacterium]